MPVKRRSSKRHMPPAAELDIWLMKLWCGRDYFDDLATVGFDDRDPDVQDAVLEAAEDVWRRVGSICLAKYGDPKSDFHPRWALEQFGMPPGAPRCQ